VTVLDSSALLAYLRAEPGDAVVEQALRKGATIGAANWAEVLSKLVDLGHDDPAVIARDLASQGLIGGLLEVAPLTEVDALTIARLRPRTRGLGLSLGDRACLALGERTRATVYTADRAWSGLQGVPITVIR
jgi:ribonuclease VapC